MCFPKKTISKFSLSDRSLQTIGQQNLDGSPGVSNTSRCWASNQRNSAQVWTLKHTPTRIYSHAHRLILDAHYTHVTVSNKLDKFCAAALIEARVSSSFFWIEDSSGHEVGPVGSSSLDFWASTRSRRHSACNQHTVRMTNKQCHNELKYNEILQLSK